LKEKPRFFILVGDEEAWKVGLKKTQWGFSDNSKGLWRTSKIGDYLAFYATSPHSKIIGFGSITDKFIDDSLIWPDEKYLFKKSIWSYRIKFKVFHKIVNWDKGIKPPLMPMNTGRKVIDAKVFCSLVNTADKNWKTKIHEKLSSSPKYQDDIKA